MEFLCSEHLSLGIKTIKPFENFSRTFRVVELVPVRAVVKQASMAFPPFLSASVPACTARALLVPATKPFPSLNANGFGRRCECWSDRASILWKSLGNHVFGENETLSGGSELSALQKDPKRRNALKFCWIMAIRSALLKTQRMIAKYETVVLVL